MLGSDTLVLDTSVRGAVLGWRADVVDCMNRTPATALFSLWGSNDAPLLRARALLLAVRICPRVAPMLESILLDSAIENVAYGDCTGFLEFAV